MSDGLDHSLSATQVAIFGLSSAIGTGLFLGSRQVLQLAGPAALVAFVITAVLALVVMYAMGELTLASPSSGGFGEATATHLGPLAGFVARWNIALTDCIAVGFEVMAITTYLGLWLPHVPKVVLACTVSAVIVALNFLAVGLYGRVEMAMTMIKVGVIALFILTGVGLLVARTSHGVDPMANLTAGGFAPGGTFGILQAGAVAVLSYGGIEATSIAAGESADPATTIPKAFRILSIMLVGACVLAIGMVVLLEPWQTSVATEQSPFVQVFTQLGIGAAGSLMNVVLIIAAFSAGLGLMYATTRILHSLASDRLAPAGWSRVNARGIPVRAVASASAGMGLGIALMMLRPDDAFALLTGVLVFGITVTWSMVLLTHMAYRRHLGTPAGFRLAGAPVTTGAALALLWLMLVVLWWVPSLQIAVKVGPPYLAIMLASGWWATSRRQSESGERD